MSMGDVYLIPAWFLGFDSVMEVLFSLITLIIAFVAFKVYRLSCERTVRHLSIGFALIGISYLIWACIHLSLVTALSADISVIYLENLPVHWVIGVYAYLILFLSGLVTLAYATTRAKHGGIYYLLLGLTILIIFSSIQKILTFRIVSMFLLSYIAYHYYWEYLAHRNIKTLLTCSAFALLFISSIDLIFAQHYSAAYVVGHFLEFAAYGLLLGSLVHTIHHGSRQKEKPPRSHT